MLRYGMLGSEPTNSCDVPYHISNYPIFGVAFGLIPGERDTPTDCSYILQ